MKDGIAWLRKAARQGTAKSQDSLGCILAKGQGVPKDCKEAAQWCRMPLASANYVTLVGKGAIGVDAQTGKLLWHYNRVANGTAVIPTPLVWDDYVFVSRGYGTGAAPLKIVKGGGTGSPVSAEEKYFLNASTFQNHHGGMVRVGD